MLALNSIILCMSGIVFPILWNKYRKLYNSYGILLAIEVVGYTIIGALIYTGIIGNAAYYLLETLLFSTISKNIICGGNRLRSIRYNSEQLRERYDNNSTIVSNSSSLIGFSISIIITIPVNISFILITLGVCIDNIFYYSAYRKSLSNLRIKKER